jgi:hypothetical protein
MKLLNSDKIFTSIEEVKGHIWKQNTPPRIGRFEHLGDLGVNREALHEWSQVESRKWTIHQSAHAPSIVHIIVGDRCGIVLWSNAKLGNRRRRRPF